ncbi:MULTISPECIES: hypothetical protein [unclassified Mannheimia]|uniref:hypothetical protein n=1 Tax=unclassified Mannheimia TaxID=2645054 RepID=UPI00359DAE17
MIKETKNSALATVRSFHYQVLIGLMKCYDMNEGDTVYIEKDGDVSLIAQNCQGIQIEAKDFSDNLTDHHTNFWKTLKNWLLPEFNHKQYSSLILHTTQPFGARSKLKQWNNLSAEEKLYLLKDINQSRINNDSDISRFEDMVLSNNEELLKEVISKFYIFTEQEKEDELIRSIYLRIALSGIPEGNISAYKDSLIGFVYNQGNKTRWSISYKDFHLKLMNLTHQFSRSVFTFPQFEVREATTDEVIENLQKDFVIKIIDIDYSEVVPTAIGDYIQLISSLDQELDNYPKYYEYTKEYQAQLIERYKSKYRIAKRNKKNPQDLYDDMIGESPSSIGEITPHLSYKNGLIHDAMNSDIDLKWEVK